MSPHGPRVLILTGFATRIEPHCVDRASAAATPFSTWAPFGETHTVRHSTRHGHGPFPVDPRATSGVTGLRQRKQAQRASASHTRAAKVAQIGEFPHGKFTSAPQKAHFPVRSLPDTFAVDPRSIPVLNHKPAPLSTLGLVERLTVPLWPRRHVFLL